MLIAAIPPRPSTSWAPHNAPHQRLSPLLLTTSCPNGHHTQQQHKVLLKPQVSWFLILTWHWWKQKQFLLQRQRCFIFSFFKQHSKDLFTTSLYSKALWLFYHHLVTMEKPHKACVLSCLAPFVQFGLFCVPRWRTPVWTLRKGGGLDSPQTAWKAKAV